MCPGRALATGLLVALLPAATSLGAQEWLDSGLMSNSAVVYRNLDREDDALREARLRLDACAQDCLTPVEAVETAFLAGPGQRTRGRFLLDVKGGGADPRIETERYFYLNSHRDFRRYGTLVLAFDPEVMRKLLNPPLPRPRQLEEGDIVVEADRPRRNVALNRSNMMRRFANRRLVVDGEVGLEWIEFIGTRGREGVAGEGYYQVWVRIVEPGQVRIVEKVGQG